MRSGRTAAARTIFTTCGVWLVLLGLYFILARPALLPEDLRYMDGELDRIQEAAPGAEAWLQHVFAVMGGFIAGSGVLTILAAATALNPSRRSSWGALASAGVLTVGTMAVVNFQLDSQFKWLLVVPAVLWLAGLVILLPARRPSSQYP